MLVVDSRFGKNGQKLIFLKTNSPKPFHNGLHGKCVDLILQEIVEVYLYHFDHAKTYLGFPYYDSIYCLHKNRFVKRKHE